MRQPLAAVLRARHHSRPAALAVLLVGLREALRRADLAALEGAALLVAGLVQRLQHAVAEVRHLGDDVHDQLFGGLLEAGQTGEARAVEELVVGETQVAQGSFVVEHL